MTTDIATLDNQTTDRVAERLAKLPAIGTLPSSEGMASLHLADVLALTGRLPNGCANPREMYVSWPVELSYAQMVEMGRDVPGFEVTEIDKVYRDPQADLERHQYQFESIKASNYPDYSDHGFRVNDLRRRMAELRKQIGLLDQSITTGTETFVAFGIEGHRKLSPAGRGRLGNLRVNYETLYMEMEERLAELEGRDSKREIGEGAISAAERRLARFRQQHQQSNVNLTVINDNRTQIVQTGTAPSQSQEHLNGKMPNMLPAP